MKSIDHYIVALNGNILICKDLLVCLEDIQKGKIIFEKQATKTTTKTTLEEYLILKLHSLFDKTKGTVSLPNLLNQNPDLSEEKKGGFIKDLQKIEKDYYLLIQRVKNNRHKRIAHSQLKEELGWDEETVRMIRQEIEKEYGKMKGEIDGLKSVKPEYVDLRRDLPKAAISNLLDNIRSMIGRCATPLTSVL